MTDIKTRLDNFMQTHFYSEEDDTPFELTEQEIGLLSNQIGIANKEKIEWLEEVIGTDLDRKKTHAEKALDSYKAGLATAKKNNSQVDILNYENTLMPTAQKKIAGVSATLERLNKLYKPMKERYDARQAKKAKDDAKEANDIAAAEAKLIEALNVGNFAYTYVDRNETKGIVKALSTFFKAGGTMTQACDIMASRDSDCRMEHLLSCIQRHWNDELGRDQTQRVHAAHILFFRETHKKELDDYINGLKGIYNPDYIKKAENALKGLYGEAKTYGYGSPVKRAYESVFAQ